MDTKEIIGEIRQIRFEVRELKEELQRYKGFVGGVAWCLSALTALVGFVWGSISTGNH